MCGLEFLFRVFPPVNRPVSHRVRFFVELAFAIGLLVPVALGQKPPAPAPRPSPNNPSNPTLGSVQPNQPREDLIMFLLGRVATADGTPVPNDVMIERVCNTGVRQQVHAGPRGDFSMQLGSRNDSYLDATGDQVSQDRVNSRNSESGIPRQELAKCE